MLFLIDGAYHVLFGVCQLCEECSLDRDSETAARECITPAMNLVADLVQSEIKSDKAFTFNRFFKDAKTKVKIQAEAESGKYKPRKKSIRVRR